MTRHFCRVFIFVLLGVAAAAMPARASTLILSDTHQYDWSGVSDSVTIKVDVFNQDSSYLWRYTVTNNGFATGNGFSGFELALPVGIFGATDIANITAPNPSWNVDCCSGEPVEWDISNVVGNGLLVGDTGVFSFTTLPRQISNSTGWFHTWENGTQASITNYSDTPGASGPEAPNLLLAPTVVPLPPALPMFGAALLAIGLFAWRRRCAPTKTHLT